MGLRQNIAKLIRLKVKRPDYDALLQAVVNRDRAALAAELDKAIVFEGAIGSVIEIVDASVFEEVAELIGGLIEEGISRGMDKIAADAEPLDVDGMVRDRIAELIRDGKLSRVAMPGDKLPTPGDLTHPADAQPLPPDGEE